VQLSDSSETQPLRVESAPMSRRIAIIGSRERTDRDAVARYVKTLPIDVVVVSGGAEGPDTFAEMAAIERGLKAVVHRPTVKRNAPYFEVVKAYHARNQAIIDDCDEVVAFVGSKRKGGTEDAIKRAKKAGKPVTIL